MGQQTNCFGAVTRIKPNIGAQQYFDGVELTVVGPNTQGRADYITQVDSRLVQAIVKWQGTGTGDIAWVAIINPSGDGSPAAQANAGQNQVDVGPTLAPFYDPANGATSIEFWNAGDTAILEVGRIISRNGDILTLENNLSLTHPVTELIKARYGGFSPVRGTEGIDGGIRTLGEAEFLFSDGLTYSGIVPKGFIISTRYIAAAGVGTRELSVNFRLSIEPNEKLG